MKMHCSKHCWSIESKTLQHLHVVVAALLQYALGNKNKKYTVPVFLALLHLLLKVYFKKYRLYVQVMKFLWSHLWLGLSRDNNDDDNDAGCYTTENSWLHRLIGTYAKWAKKKQSNQLRTFECYSFWLKTIVVSKYPFNTCAAIKQNY